MDTPNKHPKEERVNLRLTEEDFAAYNAAAVRVKLSLSQWIRYACDFYLANESKKDEPKKDKR